MKRKEDSSENETKNLMENKKFKKPKTFNENLSSNRRKQNNKISVTKSYNNDKLKKNFKRPQNSGKSFKNFPEKNDQQPAILPKPNWQEIKKERKQLKVLRKTKKLNDLFEISVEAKKICEDLRRKDCDPEERKNLSKKLHELLSGNYPKLIMKRGISHVIQWLIKYSSPEIKKSIISELKPSLFNMLQSEYASTCIKKFLEFGTKDVKNEIISACYGHVVKLITHSFSSPIINLIYKTHANRQAKMYLKQEFYGDMYKNSKDNSIKSLKDLLGQAPGMKSAILSALKLNLIKVLNKNLLSSAIIQSLLLEYLTLCSTEDRSEFIVMLRNLIVELSETKDGIKVAMICFWYGNAKDRKISIKSMKDKIKNIAMSEHAYLILLSMFDCLDDTVLAKKIFFPEFLMHLEEIISTESGRKVILYLVARRDTHYFSPKFFLQLQEGDNNTTSKKPTDIRAKEMLEAVIEPLLESITNKIEIWFANSAIAVVSLAILKVGSSEKLQQAFQALADFLINPKSVVEEGKTTIEAIEHSGIHMVLKKLIIADKNLIEKNQITFGEILINKLDDVTLKHWAEYNRACFLLVLLLENETDLIVQNLKSKLKSIDDVLKCKQFPAAPILLEKIKNK